MRLEDCYNKGLLRRRRPDILKSERALEIAKEDLNRAMELLNHSFYIESRLISYTAMFQAARALLFKDGVFERSHACVVEYLRKNYTREHILGTNYINWLDSLRVDRHESLYGLEKMDVTQEDANDSYQKASKFIQKIEEILKGNK